MGFRLVRNWWWPISLCDRTAVT